jgi:anti-sigma regulatory factor (Ser/Thr protein kinase)
MEWHPLDRLESALGRPANLQAVLHQLESEDLPTAAEFIGLRWIWWKRNRSDLLSLLAVENWPALNAFRALARGYEVLVNGAGAGLSAESQSQSAHTLGVHQLPPFGSDEWKLGGSVSAYQECFHAALRQAGMKPKYAGALTGALTEMASNAVEHASSPASPVASFEVTRGSWSFGVTDVGRGVLASLQENPAYAELEGEGEALKLVLQEGVSRTGKPDRGLGFSSVFKALVDRRATLRFRSGGAVASWEGVSPTEQTICSQGLPVTRHGFHVRVAGPI